MLLIFLQPIQTIGLSYWWIIRSALGKFYAPVAAFIALGLLEKLKTLSLVEMSLGAVIGAITFSGLAIAFGKLQGIMSGSPIVFKGQHLVNLLIGLIIIAGIVYFCFNQDQKCLFNNYRSHFDWIFNYYSYWWG